MAKRVLLIGYGSIGRRHAALLGAMGIRPYVLTRHPAGARAEFISSLDGLKGKKIDSCIICSPTNRHLKDFEQAISALGTLKRVLIEKPLEATHAKGQRISKLAKKYGIKVYVAYNLRFLRSFSLIKDFVRRNLDSIRIIEVVAGQDLRDWRRDRKIEETYSAHRSLGGGVDLDLSHEIDYLLWIFGVDFKKKFILRRKISSLKIDSPDIFKLVLDYSTFIASVTLDYIRTSKERYLRIICDNRKSLYFDLVKGRLQIDGKTVLGKDAIKETYKKMLQAFLSARDSDLCSLGDGLKVLQVLGV